MGFCLHDRMAVANIVILRVVQEYGRIGVIAKKTKVRKREVVLATKFFKKRYRKSMEKKRT